MKDTKSRFTLRTESELLDKLGYIAMFEGRTKNKELIQIIKTRIASFESINGEITKELIRNLK